MIQHLKSLLAAIAVLVVLGENAKADDPRELKTEKGKSVVVANFIAARPDCSTIPGPQPLPALREKPQHGGVGLQIVATDVAAAGNCPARKVPSLVLFYVPSSDFVGVDAIQIEVDTGNNKTAIVAYRITVQAPETK